jgi:hypothetical protein
LFSTSSDLIGPSIMGCICAKEVDEDKAEHDLIEKQLKQPREREVKILMLGEP